MTPKSDAFKAAMASVRERIAASKRQVTRRGFIDYRGCLTVTHDFSMILEEAGDAAERGEYAFAYAVAALILINLAKVACMADDSAGGITDARGKAVEILEKACEGVKYGSQEAEYIYLQSIKDCRNKAFDGYEDFSYDFLLETARLATVKNQRKMLDAASDLYRTVSEMSYGNWADDFDALIRLEIIKATGGAADVAAFVEENLAYDAIRRIAVREAIDAGNYGRAEMLCLDRLKTDGSNHPYARISEWRYLLFETYDKSGDAEKKIQTAKDLLNRFDTKYFAVLKRLLIEKGVWETESGPLFSELSSRLPSHLFMQILAGEGLDLWLLNEIRKVPTSIFQYGRRLAEVFPSETYALCQDVIRNQAREADNRDKYRKVCGLIKQLAGFGGVQEADDVVAELTEKFPRRPAMIDELNALRGRLAKRGIK